MRFPIVIAGIIFSSQVAVAADPVDIKKLSYGIGVMLDVRMLAEFDDLDIEQVIEGLRDAHDKKTLKVDLQEAGELMSQYMENKSESRGKEAIENGKAYLLENAKKDEVKTTDSGLQYEVLKQGDGPKPKATDKVTVHYKGTLINGETFDSSIDRGEPTSFSLNGVIPGWIEGLQLMNVGSKYRFVIPSDLAYAERGAGQAIGPHETLIFEVELISIDK